MATPSILILAAVTVVYPVWCDALSMNFVQSQPMSVLELSREMPVALRHHAMYSPRKSAEINEPSARRSHSRRGWGRGTIWYDAPLTHSLAVRPVTWQNTPASIIGNRYAAINPLDEAAAHSMRHTNNHHITSSPPPRPSQFHPPWTFTNRIARPSSPRNGRRRARA